MPGRMYVLVNAHGPIPGVDRQETVAKYLDGDGDNLAVRIDFNTIEVGSPPAAGGRLIPAPMLTNPRTNGLVPIPSAGVDAVTSEVDALRADGVGVAHRLALFDTPATPLFGGAWMAAASRAGDAGFEVVRAGSVVRSVLEQGAAVVVETSCRCVGEHGYSSIHGALDAFSLLGVSPWAADVEVVLVVDAAWAAGVGSLAGADRSVRLAQQTYGPCRPVLVGAERLWPDLDTPGGELDGISDGSTVLTSAGSTQWGEMLSAVQRAARLTRTRTAPKVAFSSGAVLSPLGWSR